MRKNKKKKFKRRKKIRKIIKKKISKIKISKIKFKKKNNSHIISKRKDQPKEQSIFQPLIKVFEKLREKTRAHKYLASMNRCRPSSDSLDRVIELLSKAKRPLIIAGSETRWFDSAEELKVLAEKIQIPVATAHNARGILSEKHPLSIGLVGWIGLKPTNNYLENSDLIIAIGASLSDYTTSDWKRVNPSASIVHVTMRSRELNRQYVADVNIMADSTSALADLNDKLAKSKKNISFKEELELFARNTENFSTTFNTIITKLGNLSKLEETTATMEGALSYRVKANEYFIPMTGLVDIDAEIEKIKDELAYTQGFLKSVDKKLSNERFVNNAPDNVVASEKQKQADAKAKIEALENRLAALS